MSEPAKKVEHTPGPWAIHRYNLSARHFDGKGHALGPRLPWFISPESDADKTYGGSVDPIADKNNYAQVLCNLESGYRHRSDEEIWANAKLLAAAPELVEALENTTQTLRLMNVVNADAESREEVRKEIALAQEVITKARAGGG